MNKKIKHLVEEAGGYYLPPNTELGKPGHAFLEDEQILEFAFLLTEEIESEAIKLIKMIANDYVELSHDKIKWQRDDYIKRCRKFLDNYVENDDEQQD